MTKFVYKPEEISRWSDYQKPYWIHYTSKDAAEIVAEFRGYLQKKCIPFVVFNDSVYAAGPMNLLDIGATAGQLYRDYYKISDIDGFDIKNLNPSNTYNFDAELAMSNLIVNETSENISVIVPLPGKPAVLDASGIEFDWYINRVNVPENYRRSGVGFLMMKHAISSMLKMGAVGISVYPGGYDVPKDMQEAFYAKCGFVHTDSGMKYLFINPSVWVDEELKATTK